VLQGVFRCREEKSVRVRESEKLLCEGIGGFAALEAKKRVDRVRKAEIYAHVRIAVGVR